MLSLVRSGVTVINICAKGQPEELLKAIESMASPRSTSPMESYNNSGEEDTLIFVSSEGSRGMLTYQTVERASEILCLIINKRLADKIERVRITPPNIIMRLLGDPDRAIDQIAADFKARETETGNLMQNQDEEAVLVNFTSEPLNQVVKTEDFHRRALLIDKPYGQLLTFLRARAQEYLNMAMGSPDWNEIAITLFDAMDQYNLHYQRLVTVLQGLDVGIVVSESWEPEYTVAMRKSEVYQVRLITPLPPQAIKGIAMGLEYDEEGRRVVDLDVYDKKRKIGWASEKGIHGGSRADIGLMHRNSLLDSLPPEAKAVLLNFDLRINKSDLSNS